MKENRNALIKYEENVGCELRGTVPKILTCLVSVTSHIFEMLQKQGCSKEIAKDFILKSLELSFMEKDELIDDTINLLNKMKARMEENHGE